MSVSRLNRALLAMLTTVLMAACADQATDPQPQARIARQFSEGVAELQLADGSGDVASFLASVNRRLSAEGARYAVRQVDISLAGKADPETKTTVFANDRTHRLGYQFVAGDPRRATVGEVLRQASFAPFSLARTGPTVGGMTPRIPAKPAIDASFATWNRVQCSTLTVVNNTLPGNVFPSAVLPASLFFGPSSGLVNNPVASDINTLGFLPGVIFDLLFGPGSSEAILGLTIPFVFLDEEGNPTDIDGDGQDDVAFAEIWYNDAFQWGTTGTGPKIDIETVALHENGHALGLGHFGKIFLTGNGKLHAAPRAVMNAFVLGTLRSPLGTDNGSFCSYWASWPN